MLSNQNVIPKISFYSFSSTGARHPVNFDSYGKFPISQSQLSVPKGQLFLIADAKSPNPAGEDAGRMALQLIQENYFSYPSEDISFCLKRAFDIANRQLYQYAQANGLHRRIGCTCSALVLTDKFAHIAHVGDCRIYRISVRGIELLTQDHTRKVDNGGTERTVISRALGIKLGVKVDTPPRQQVSRDEHYLLCSDGMREVSPAEIRSIVLSSSAQKATQKLADLARSRGSDDDVTIQLIKVYHDYNAEVAEPYVAHREAAQPLGQKWPLYLIVFLSVLTGIFFFNGPFRDNFDGLIQQAVEKYQQIQLGSGDQLTPEEMEERQLARADAFWRRGRLDDALKIYQSILSNSGQHPDALQGIAAVARAYRRKGDAAFQRENFRNASNYYKKALALMGTDDALEKLIAKCEEKLSAPIGGLAEDAGSIPATLPVRESSRQYSARAVLDRSIQGFQSRQWQMSGLDAREDFIVHQNKLTFLENLRIKKAFHSQSYDSVEVEVLAQVLSGERAGKYGLIFGSEPEALNGQKRFYLFSVDRNGHYALQQVSQRQVRILDAGYIKPNILGDFQATQLKVKCLGRLILLYVNGQSLNILPVEQAVHGGVGLYADPRLRVDFSDFKVAPIRLN